MTHLKLKLFSLSALFVLLLASCSQEQDAENTSTSQKNGVSVRTTLQLSTSGDLRTNQIIDNTTNTTTPLLTADYLNIRVVISRSGGTPQHQTLKFKRTADLTAAYDGEVTVPTDGTGDFDVTAILLNEEDASGSIAKEYAKLVNGSNKVEAIAAPNTLIHPTEVDGKNVLPSTLPYIAQHTANLTLNGSELVQNESLQFKPNGTLLRLRLTNWTFRVETFTQLKIKTNAFVTNWTYDLENLTGGNLAYGSTDSFPTEYTYSIPNPTPLDLEDTDARDFYIWVMPTQTTTGLSTKIYAVNNKGEEFLAFNRSSVLKSKYISARMEVQPKLPLVSLIEAPIKGTLDNLSLSPTGLDATYYTVEEAYTLGQKGDFTIGDNTFYLPDIKELRSIFPRQNMFSATTAKTDTDGVVLFPNTDLAEFSNTTSEYKSVNKVLYAIRFKDNTYRKLIAYRYELRGTFTTNSSSNLVVTSRYLGPAKKNLTIDDVATETFWTTNNESDVPKMFHALGYIERPAGSDASAYTKITQKGEISHFYAKSGRTTLSLSEFYRFSKDGIWAQTHASDKRTTRVFRRYYTPGQTAK